MKASFDITAEEIPIFLAEAVEHLQMLDDGLVRLERGDDDPALLQAIFRAAHTLKGSAGMIGHKRMVKVTHALEAAFDGLRKGKLVVTAGLIDTCLETVDLLRLLCAEVETGELQAAEIDPLVENINQLAQLQAGNQAPSVARAPQAGIQPNANTPATKSETQPGNDYLIQADISPDSIAPAARAFQIMLALQELGEITSMTPSQEEIESASPVERLAVHFVPSNELGSPAAEKIRAALNAISEIDRLHIREPEAGNAGQTPQPPSNGAPQRSQDETRLGDLLLNYGLVTREQLSAALETQQNAEGPRPVLGQTLVKMGAISQEALDQVVAEQKRQKQPPQEEVEKSPADKIRLRVTDKTVRTSVERLDILMNLVGELITDRNRLVTIRGELETRFHGDDRIEAISETITHVGRITDQLQAEVMGIRMLPISNVFNKFPRMVRDLARKAGKQIDLIIRGEDTELDRSVIEEISDPLIHLLRNAVDHGIEPTEERTTAGKPERGIIRLDAYHEQGRIVLTIEDDGGGIDLERVKSKAVEKGMFSQSEADALTDEEALDLIFLSGLSTARVVSDVSGRGVGMDIVRNNIERLNGHIQVETWPGRGTKFQIVLPLTLAIVPTLLVRVGNEKYAIPLVTVSETLRIAQNQIQTVNGRPVITLRARILPVIHLAQVFNLATGTNGQASSLYKHIVVVRAGKSAVGLIVEGLFGEEEVVVKSLNAVVGEVPGISSAAILGDGRVALIVDVPGLIKLAQQQFEFQKEERMAAA